ncbi:MAG: UDP-N-acetylmuramoyl-tripeptide--D-alanyl-D-alanine ligase [bacterium]|nr:UDP-N-acetylmuramoyl-tripeptide--D-alanyl-D-alanine ligase [bacterium]
MELIKSIAKKIIVVIITLEARLVIKKYKPKIIAITGSVGKTSTKDAVYEVIATSFIARKSEKSFNSEIGIPLTILGVSNAWGNPLLWAKNILSGLALILLRKHYPQWLVLEVGLEKPGDIRDVTKWLTPDIVIMTKFSDVPVHVEFFSSPAALMEEKAALVDVLKKEGLLVLNYDDEKVLALKQKSKSAVFTFGFSDEATIRASHDEIEYDKEGNPEGTIFKVNHDGTAVPAHLPGTVGRQYIYSVLAALCVGSFLKINMITMVEAVAKFKTPNGRSRVIKGVKNTYIIDDTYNSSPIAVEAAIATLSQFKTKGRKIAVLGDMLELGKYAVTEHKRIGTLAGGVCNTLLCIGVRARYFAEGAEIGGLSEKNIFQFDDTKEAGKFLELFIKDSDVILVKGSQSMRMERIVEEIMAHPEEKGELLVRQEEEWQTR